MIEDRNVQPGAVFASAYKGTRRTAEAKGSAEGIVYVLDDGREFKSLSGAGHAVTGKACNGWVFWSPANAVAEPTPKAEKAPRAARTAPTRIPKNTKPAVEKATKAKVSKIVPRKVRQVKPTPSQDNCPEGERRYHCSACMKAFCAPLAEIVTACPEGHTEFAIDDLAPIDVERELQTADA